MRSMSNKYAYFENKTFIIIYCTSILFPSKYYFKVLRSSIFSCQVVSSFIVSTSSQCYPLITILHFKNEKKNHKGLSLENMRVGQVL